MKQALLLLNISVLSITLAQAQTISESVYLDSFRAPNEQNLKLGRNAAWALPLVATQYQSQHPLPVMKEAMEAQDDARYLEAIILLDDAIKSGQGSEEGRNEVNLLRASFLLQGGQFEEVRGILAPLLSHPRHAASAYALTAMSHLQQGRMQEALQTAQQARGKEGGILPPLVLSYALQGEGRLAEARDAVHEYNRHSPEAVTLAREAELDLTLDQVQSARVLLRQAREKNGAHPYVTAVSGLARLIYGQAGKAKADFETALKRDPKDPKMLLGLGLAEIKLGNQQTGLKNLQAANEAEPNNSLILTYLGRAELQAGQEEKARATWRSAQQADRNDPAPWLYQAQAELQASQLQQAQESVRQAQARTASRAVYRGERLRQEDEQLLQANLAEIQRRQGLEGIAFHTLADPVGEKNSATLRSMAGLLEGRRFGESARRSLLLQSLFNEYPGSLPATLDIYGDGAGQTGAAVPQHGVVSGLTAQRATYHNYDELFGGRAHLEADAITGNQNTHGEQIRFGVGNDLFGVSMAQRQFKTDGSAPFENLDNRIAQATVQWRPFQSTQLFLSHQAFHSQHGETKYPADTLWAGEYHQIDDNSGLTRLGFRHDLGGSSELRGVASRQQTDQTDNANLIAFTPPYSLMPPFFGPTVPFPLTTWYYSSKAQGGELQYRHSSASHASQFGVSAVRERLDSQWGTFATIAQQAYANWQQALNPYWQLEAGLALGKHYQPAAFGDIHLSGWMPKLGLVYVPDNATHVRLAAWKSLDNVAVGNASLAPAMLAGVELSRPGDNHKQIRSIALGADKQLGAAWLLEGQMQRRFEDFPTLVSGAQIMYSSRVDESRLALHWRPGNQALNVTMAYEDEFIQNAPQINPMNSVVRQHLRSHQLGLRWQASSQWAANLAWSRNRVAATQLTNTFDVFLNPVPTLLDAPDCFNQTDASLNWQFIKRSSVDIGVRNASGKRLQYTNIDPLTPRFSNGRLAYIKARFTW